MVTRFSQMILLAAALAVPPSAMATVSEFMLDNGMKVLVKPDRRAPVVVSQVWYRVGASYEPDGLTGISHALEHMMFKGTESLGPGEFSKTISALGGDENAFTGRDYTAYFETLAAEHLETALKLEADRMRNLRLDPEEFAKEIEVVKEERRLRTEDRPSGKVFEQFSAVAWRASPYQNPVIGWMNDLENMELEDLAAWYRRYYSPNNAILVVVGDVEPDAVFDLARRYFGTLEPSDIPTLKPPAEPPQSGETRVKVRAPAKQPYVLMGYKTPVIGKADSDWEPYALYVLSSVLDGGNSARLSRELVRGDGIAASAGADYSSYSRLDNMFVLSATPTDEHSVADVEKALREQVRRMREETIDPAELQRVVTQAVAGKVFEADSLFYQAMEIGMLETIGLDWRLAKQEIARLKAVTPEQVQEVARRYLVDDNLTVAILEPLPIENQPIPRRALAGGRHGS
jgi:zinc protease